MGLEPAHGHPELSLQPGVGSQLCDLGQTTSPLRASVCPGVKCRWPHLGHTVNEVTWTEQAAQSWPRAQCTVASVRGSFHDHGGGRPCTIHGEHPHCPGTPHPPQTLAARENKTCGHSQRPLHMPGSRPRSPSSGKHRCPGGQRQRAIAGGLCSGEITRLACLLCWLQLTASNIVWQAGGPVPDARSGGGWQEVTGRQSGETGPPEERVPWKWR